MKKFGFCPMCGAPLSWEKGPHPVCTACAFVFYQNSSPTVSVIFVNRNSEVLLSQRGIDPFKGYWDCVGGFLEHGEDPEAGVKREVQEELGVDVDIIRILDIIPDEYEHGGRIIKTLNIYYYGIPGSLDFKPMDDISGVAWLPLDPLPDKLAFTNNARILTTVRTMLADGSLTV